MLDSEQKTTTSNSSLAEDLLQLSNEFNAFNDFYACFCDTLADVVVVDQVLDAGSVEGISRWMKYRMDEIRSKLDAIQKKFCKRTKADPGFHS